MYFANPKPGTVRGGFIPHPDHGRGGVEEGRGVRMWLLGQGHSGGDTVDFNDDEKPNEML